MDAVTTESWEARVALLVELVEARVPAMRARGADAAARTRIPLDDITYLWEIGAFTAPVPVRHGGLGLGTEAAGAPGLLDLLRTIGNGNLALGRIFEGHANALQLICEFGDEAQMAMAAQDARSGHLFAIWNTEIPPGVRLAETGLLTGGKSHCSAAGVATRGVITVDQHLGGRLLVAPLAPGERASPIPGEMVGMQATQSGAIDFAGYSPSRWIGGVGDYLREPMFSGGAWRTLAVLTGGLERLVEEITGQLRARERDGAPQQRARIAEALIALETARLWVAQCAALVEGRAHHAAEVAGYVNLARRAVEAACLVALQLAQRSLGLQAFSQGNPVSALMLDLSTYLRQPAMDEGLDSAAAYFVEHPLPRVGAP